MSTVYLRQAAMASHFEIWLVGEDAQHLRAVGQAATAELLRLERLLSRHDPASELYRLNRADRRYGIRIERELHQVLTDCLEWEHRTDGVFNIASPGSPHRTPLHRSIELHASRSQARITQENVTLDLGGYGKGYALDRMAAILREHGVNNFMIQGGTSSALAEGRPENGLLWEIGIQTEKLKWPIVHSLDDQGFSASEGKCAIFAPEATSGEVYSTVCAQMGREASINYLQRQASSHLQLFWLDNPQIPLLINPLT